MSATLGLNESRNLCKDMLAGSGDAEAVGLELDAPDSIEISQNL